MLEESGVIFKVRLVAPMPTKRFDSGANEWAAHNKARSPDKIRAGANKPIEKIKVLIKEKARSEGITEDEALKKYPVLFDMLKRYQLSKANTLKALQENGTGCSKFGDGVERGKGEYDKTRRESYYPLIGSRKYDVKGLIFLGLMALTGDRQLRKWLKPGLDKIITGKPVCICRPENLKDFRKQLRFQIAESGAVIIKDDFSVDVRGSQNETLNRLANQYRLDKLAPFSPAQRSGVPTDVGSGASHIDFIVVDVPDPDMPGKMKKRLGLDIQVSKKD